MWECQIPTSRHNGLIYLIFIEEDEKLEFTKYIIVSIRIHITGIRWQIWTGNKLRGFECVKLLLAKNIFVLKEI